MTPPRLSVVLIGYDMARELPRTLYTLSAAYQRDIAPADYEIILIDNGSPQPPDLERLQASCPGLRFQRIDNALPSPVAAINQGLSIARGELIGVMIDGARMASPRLLATALEASRMHPMAVIGTIAFHLGPEVQMRSVAKGYDQAEEDRLLDSVGWRDDGYELFRISVFAGSSAQGWFAVPSETNALFLGRAQWEQLGGYDPAFVAPGGGLVNLDTWARACALPGAQVTMLLGETTFHQVHGGVATNAARSRWDEFHDEFVAIRGHAFRPPQPPTAYYGRIPPQAWPSVSASRPPAR